MGETVSDKRREQMNFSPAKYPDDVYAFLERLAHKRTLTAWVEEQAKRAIAGNSASCGCCREVMKELAAMKELLLRLPERRSAPLVGQATELHHVLELVSSDRAARTLATEDTSYNF